MSDVCTYIELKIPPEIPVFGEVVKGCKVSETMHMVTFFNTLRREYPQYGGICIHVRNEGKRTQHQIDKERASGLVTGCCDIILPGNPTLCIELKSQSPSAKISPEQIAYLLAAQAAGAYSCIALGYTGAMLAFNAWRQISTKLVHNQDRTK